MTKPLSLLQPCWNSNVVPVSLTEPETRNVRWNVKSWRIPGAGLPGQPCGGGGGDHTKLANSTQWSSTNPYRAPTWMCSPALITWSYGNDWYWPVVELNFQNFVVFVARMVRLLSGLRAGSTPPVGVSVP